MSLLQRLKRSAQGRWHVLPIFYYCRRTVPLLCCLSFSLSFSEKKTLSYLHCVVSPRPILWSKTATCGHDKASRFRHISTAGTGRAIYREYRRMKGLLVQIFMLFYAFFYINTALCRIIHHDKQQVVVQIRLQREDEPTYAAGWRCTSRQRPFVSSSRQEKLSELYCAWQRAVCSRKGALSYGSRASRRAAYLACAAYCFFFFFFFCSLFCFCMCYWPRRDRRHRYQCRSRGSQRGCNLLVKRRMHCRRFAKGVICIIHAESFSMQEEWRQKS